MWSLRYSSSYLSCRKIVDHGKEICLPSGMDEMGPVTKKLYETLTGIQMGRIELLRAGFTQ